MLGKHCHTTFQFKHGFHPIFYSLWFHPGWTNLKGSKDEDSHAEYCHIQRPSFYVIVYTGLAGMIDSQMFGLWKLFHSNNSSEHYKKKEKYRISSIFVFLISEEEVTYMNYRAPVSIFKHDPLYHMYPRFIMYQLFLYCFLFFRLWVKAMERGKLPLSNYLT